MKAHLRALVLSLALAAPALATPTPPDPGGPKAGRQPVAPVPASCCGASRFSVAFAAEPTVVRVRVTDTAEGWTWESAPIAGKAVSHTYGSGSCQATVVDLDGDGVPEVVVTVDDEAPGGLVYVYRRVAGKPAMAAVPCESGSNVRPRDFLVWDLPGQASAPVTITTDGEIQVKGRLYSLLGQGSGVGTFRFRLQDGMMRYQQTQNARSPR